MVAVKKRMMKKPVPKTSHLQRSKSVRKAAHKKPKTNPNCKDKDIVRKVRHTVHKARAVVKSPVRKSKVTLSKSHSSRLARSKLGKAIQTPQTGFLSLSGELRNIIYQYTLVLDEKILVGRGDNTKKRNYRFRGPIQPPTGVPALLQTCRQVRQEGLSIFYSENTFAIHNKAREWDPRYSLTMELGDGWARSEMPSVRFMEWCQMLLREDNLRWLRKIHLCYGLNDSRAKWLSYYGDFCPYIKLAVQYPDLTITIANEGNADCGCKVHSTRPAPEVVSLAEKISIMNDPAWTSEIKAGNIIALRGTTIKPNIMRPRIYAPWSFRVKQVVYSTQSSLQLKDEDDWQELCDNLSLPYMFELVRKTARRRANFSMVVDAKPELIEVDSH